MNTDEAHFAALEGAFYAAPINEFFSPTIHVEYGTAKIELEIVDGFHHAGHAVHGAVLFKMLDDAAFFAACSTAARRASSVAWSTSTRACSSTSTGTSSVGVDEAASGSTDSLLEQAQQRARSTNRTVPVVDLTVIPPKGRCRHGSEATRPRQTGVTRRSPARATGASESVGYWSSVSRR